MNFTEFHCIEVESISVRVDKRSETLKITFRAERSYFHLDEININIMKLHDLVTQREQRCSFELIATVDRQAYDISRLSDVCVCTTALCHNGVRH